MTSFTDAEGREWHLRITLGLLPRLKAFGVDVSFAVEDVGKVSEAAFRDADTIGKVLWTLVEEQVEKAGVTPEQFALALDGPALAGAADGFTAALLAFSCRPTMARALRDKLMAIRNENETTLIEAISTSNGSAGERPAGGAEETPGPSATESSVG